MEPPILATAAFLGACPRSALGGPWGTFAEWAHGPHSHTPQGIPSVGAQSSMQMGSLSLRLPIPAAQNRKPA